MRTLFTFRKSFTCLIALVLLTFSCTNPTPGSESDVSPQPNRPSGARTAAANTTYTSSPGVGVLTSSTFGTQPYSNCGTFQGQLRAKVVSIVGDQVTVEIQRTNGSAFGYSGFGYIRATALCGTIANNAGTDRTVQSSWTFKRITFTTTFTNGTVQFYPVLILAGGRNLYGNPIAIVAQPQVSYEHFSTPVNSSPLSKCLFASLNCAVAGKYHTGVDYMGAKTTQILSIGDGTIVFAQGMNSSDHGMGGCVIIEHLLENGNKVYSLYAHLNSVGVSNGSKIKRGTYVGYMGASGYGQQNYWGSNNVHLHFELKSKGVTGSPWNGTYWGYTPNHPTTYGYLEPSTVIGKVRFVKN